MPETRTDQLRTLVVEDEFLVRLATVDMLGSLGCKTFPVGNLKEALLLIETHAFDLAVLDVNLSGMTVYPAAELLRSKKVPLVFTTGYGTRGIEEQWRGSEIVQKPYNLEQLKRAVDAALKR
jgi:CheY-like chemotaxis protein